MVGTIRGYTGRSGWIGGVPHLHCHVRESDLTLPVEFIDYHGSLDHQTLLREGKIWFGEEQKTLDAEDQAVI